MKTYTLGPLRFRSEAEDALASVLPVENFTGLLKDKQGDIIAYFHVNSAEDHAGMFSVFADVSGRHYTQDEEVLSVLREIRARIGGTIINDDSIPDVPLQEPAR